MVCKRKLFPESRPLVRPPYVSVAKPVWERKAAFDFLKKGFPKQPIACQHIRLGLLARHLITGSRSGWGRFSTLVAVLRNTRRLVPSLAALHHPSLPQKLITVLAIKAARGKLMSCCQNPAFLSLAPVRNERAISQRGATAAAARKLPRSLFWPLWLVFPAVCCPRQ